MTTTSRRHVPLIVTAAIIAALAVPGATPAVAAPLPAPVPILLPATQPYVGARDIAPGGAIVGTAGPSDPQTGPTGSTAQLWLNPRGVYVAQTLPVPEGATGATVAGVTDRAEAGGTVEFGTTSRAVRWSSDARVQPTLIGGNASRTSAVGPGEWLVDTALGRGFVEIVTRDGTRTNLDLSPNYIHGVGGLSAGGPTTALAWGSGGAGAGRSVQGVIWQDGATFGLPVLRTFSTGPVSCHSEIRPDGTVAFSGPGTQAPDGFGAGIRRGGVAGTTVWLRAGGLMGQLGCQNGDLTSDTLSADGWVAGSVGSREVAPTAALWRPNGSLVRLGKAADETSSFAVAVARGGRAVIRGYLQDGGSRLYLWQRGTRTPLPIPAGWTLSEVVEMTDRGIVLANLTNADGQRRPVVWFTGEGAGLP